jgi:hypothetical protein
MCVVLLVSFSFLVVCYWHGMDGRILLLEQFMDYRGQCSVAVFIAMEARAGLTSSDIPHV